MKIYTTSKARILFVSVPEETNDCDIENNILYADSDKWVIEKSIPLPEGKWHLLSILKDATEENAASVVDEKTIVIVRDDGSFADDVKYYFSIGPYLHYPNAYLALESIANHLGCEGNQVILVEKI